jgi:hypothetical protein
MTRALAEEIGPRRPTSIAEAAAAQSVTGALAEAGVDARLERFDGYSSFAWPYGALAALSLAPAPLPAVGAGLLALEGGLTHAPLSDALARRESSNVVGLVESGGPAERTLCLVAHLDTSRSGLLFDPRLGPAVRRLLAAQSAATFALAAAPLLRRLAAGRAALRASRALCALGLALLAERELRGVDVPGANDNASGVGAVVELAGDVAATPLRTTRLAVLICGCEEAGLLGARAFLDAHDTRGWIFLNFDGVGCPATLRYLPREGIVRSWNADPGLIAVAERVRAERPELGLEPADAPIGLTYDATAVLARGGRALTLVRGDGGRIPNYHRPSDTVANLDPDALARAVEVGRAMIARIDAGEADGG